MDAKDEGRLDSVDWEAFRQTLGYSEEELVAFRANPRREFVVQHAHRLGAWKLSLIHI